MIKAQAGDLIIIGLSNKNIERLLAHDPILFDGKEIGLPGRRFFIYAGDTEEIMIREIDDLIRPELKGEINGRA